MSLEQRIIESCRNLFLSMGVRAVTMDDIASHLGMSKKTIYQHFKDKGEIIEAVTKQHFEQEKCYDEISLGTAKNAIEGMLSIFQRTQQTFSKINPILPYEIRKYYPETWKHFEEFREQHMVQKLRQNLEWGIQEGFYRPDISIEISIRLHICEIDNIFNPLLFPPDKYNLQVVLMNSMLRFLLSITTLKGTEMIHQYLNEQSTKPTV
ncbi:MAG: TetR/AcrR family transcriptional regulator [Bacteroidia bacterium]|nr:TetR/AcrR family transcriptional regulator [Bacteroidia bacterium]